MTPTIQLLGISNAIVDVLAHIDEDFLARLGVVKGSMTLIDEERAHEVYAMMGPATEMSGGSVANSIASFANLGGEAAYIGKVRQDQLGEIFNHDMRSLGIDVRLQPAAEGAPTARSHVLITPDGQRTMCTYLGACTELGLADINHGTIGKPGAILLEGYLWDLPEGPDLARKAMRLAADAEAEIALSLSDSFCVERHRDAFRAAIDDYADIVIADEDEINALLETDTFEATMEAVRGRKCLYVMTRSAKGSVIVRGDDVIEQAADEVSDVVDTTGAGDAYCAGFLYGWVKKKSLAECARLGTFCASQVIRQLGARIEPGLLADYR